MGMKHPRQGPPPARPANGAPPPSQKAESKPAEARPAQMDQAWAALDPDFKPSGDPIRCPLCGCNAVAKCSRFRETNIGKNYRQRWRECLNCHHSFCTMEIVI